MKKAAVLILVFAFALLGLAGCGETVTPEKVAPATVQPAAQTQTYAVGDSIKMGDLVFTVNGARISKGGEFDRPGNGNKFLLISVTVQNLGQEEEPIISLIMFKFVDKEGQSYNIALTTQAQGQVDGSLAAGRKPKGELAYEVPGSLTSGELEIHPELLGQGTAVVALQFP